MAHRDMCKVHDDVGDFGRLVPSEDRCLQTCAHSAGSDYRAPAARGWVFEL